ncbi:MAG: hypothetical protein R6V07_13355, partial [Armatimonadota bacterium]
HIFAGKSGVNGVESVPVVWTGNDDSIDILALQHGTIILIDVFLVQPQPAGASMGPIQVHIAYRDSLNIIASSRPADIRGAPISSADERHVDFVAGRRDRGSTEYMAWYNGNGCAGTGNELESLTPGHSAGCVLLFKAIPDCILFHVNLSMTKVLVQS